VDLSNAIAAATQSEDRIWVGPFDPIQYCLAQRAPTSRYYFILPWTAKADVRREIVDDIVTSSPRLIVIGDYDDDGPFGLQQLLPELRGVIAQRYHLSTLHGGASFFERNAVPADSPTPANAALR
jgi:hypothetical protein